MHETLNQTLQTMDEKIAKIIEADITRLEKQVTASEFPNDNEVHDITDRMKRVGEALKTVSEGLEAYRATTSHINQQAKPVTIPKFS